MIFESLSRTFREVLFQTAPNGDPAYARQTAKRLF